MYIYYMCLLQYESGSIKLEVRLIAQYPAKVSEAEEPKMTHEVRKVHTWSTYLCLNKGLIFSVYKSGANFT
jgi:hypothetical protein